MLQISYEKSIRRQLKRNAGHCDEAGQLHMASDNSTCMKQYCVPRTLRIRITTRRVELVTATQACSEFEAKRTSSSLVSTYVAQTTRQLACQSDAVTTEL